MAVGLPQSANNPNVEHHGTVEPEVFTRLFSGR